MQGRKISAQITNLFQHKKVLIELAVILSILLGISLLFWLPRRVIRQQSSQVPPVVSPSVPTAIPAPKSAKVWEIALSFNTNTQQISVKSISIKPGTALASPSTDSPYKLLVLDKNNTVLFQTDIRIAQQILYDVYFSPNASPSAIEFPRRDTLDTLIAIPYFDNAQDIQIKKNGIVILDIMPPKQISFLPSLIRQTFAAGPTCSLLHIVFESDGYTNMSTYHHDVDRAKNTFLAKEPFASNQDIFDFQTIDNTSPIGCNNNAQLDVMCLFSSSSLTKMTDLVATTFPLIPLDQAHTKIVVLVDGAPQPLGLGYILGVANALGGQYGVFQNRLYFETTATMEVLGHDVGELYDRYLYPPSNNPQGYDKLGSSTNPAKFLTNCSPNPNGENFWQTVGITQAYKGCTSQYLYAPAPLDCGPGGSGGSKNTIMSAANCGGAQFDAVEQYWLKNTIVPRYKCVPTPTPTSTPTPAGSSVTNPLSTPVPLQEYDCAPDPNCQSGKGSQQLCTLKCTPKK